MIKSNAFDQWGRSVSLRLQLVKSLLLLVFLLSSSLAWSEPEVPEEWRDYVILERLHNTQRRRSQRLVKTEEAALKSIPIFHIDVPTSRATQYISSGISDAVLRQVHISGGEIGPPMVRIFITDPKMAEKLKNQGEYLQQEYWGVRIQGHSSFFVWKEGESPLIIKTSHRFYNFQFRGRDIRFLPSHPFNDFGILKLGVTENNVLLDIRRDFPDSKLAFLQEPYVARARLGFWLKAIVHSYSVRELVPTSGPLKPNEKLLPLHGLLGAPDYIQSLADARGQTPRQWREHYLDKLAEFFADGLFRTGVIFEGHTQNLVVRVNTKTGDIVEIVGRDLTDVTHDPHTRKSQGKSDHYEHFKGNRPRSQANDRFIDYPYLAKFIGRHLGIYGGQSVMAAEPGFSAGYRNTVYFLQRLVHHGEQITGGPIQLSKGTHRLLNGKKFLKKAVGFVQLLLRSGRATMKQQDKRAVIGVVAQELVDNVTRSTAPKLTEVHRSYPQQPLKDHFLNSVKEEQIAYLYPKSKSLTNWGRVKYAFDGEKVVAYQGDGEVIAYSLKNDGELMDWIRKMPVVCSFGPLNGGQ